MPRKNRTTNRTADVLDFAQFRRELETDTDHSDTDDFPDDWTGGGPTFSVAVCRARPGVPVSMTMRVAATTEAAARARVRKLMEYFSEGTEMLCCANYTRSGESCRVYLDPTLMRARVPCNDEGPAGAPATLEDRRSLHEIDVHYGLVRLGALDAERAATLTPPATRGIAPRLSPDVGRIDPADRDRRGRSLFNIEVCSMRPGVPVAVNLRVVADNATEARMRARHLLRQLSQGTDLLAGADFARPGESCLLQTEPTCMSNRVPLVNESAAEAW